MPITFVDPSHENIRHAWREIAGYNLNNDYVDSAHSAIWSWMSGHISTDPAWDGLCVIIRWRWHRGSVTVTVGKEKQENRPEGT